MIMLQMVVSLKRMQPREVGLMVSVSDSHPVGRGFTSYPDHTKDHLKMELTTSRFGTHA